MWTVVFVVVVLVVVAVAVAIVRRPRGADTHSVQNYHHALGTLEHLSERIGPPTVRPVRVVPSGQSETPPVRVVPTGQAEAPPERVVPPVPVRGTEDFPDPDAPIVFDDARPVERGRPVGSEPTTPPRTDRSQRIALASMNHRRRPGTGIIVAIAVIVVFVVLAVIGSQKPHKAPSAAHATTTTTLPRHTHAATTTAPKPPPTTRPTPTTLPAQFAATTTSSTQTSATYTLPHTNYMLTLTATGDCWAEVETAATGSTVWAGLLTAGNVQQVEVTGTTTVQLGAPTVNLEVDSIPVVLPTPVHTPFTATFAPSATATPGSVPTTTTTTAP